ncbi:hypothetical protein [Rubrobacter calidifluminis]|uniref:hypothetical protein n=1 Tax=Rubrobacter calidifluminis TaxID=1392640 RepID=UPI00235F940D|nr:hypothetical protein [Rubrobacter calidifluminis]
MGGSRVVLELSVGDARELHAALEELIESGLSDVRLLRFYRLLGWRILASCEGGGGLTGRLAELARRAETLEEYEATRERELGPILRALEDAEQRDA